MLTLVNSWLLGQLWPKSTQVFFFHPKIPNPYHNSNPIYMSHFDHWFVIHTYNFKMEKWLSFALSNQPPYVHDQASKGIEPIDMRWAAKENHNIIYHYIEMCQIKHGFSYEQPDTCCRKPTQASMKQN